MKKSAKREMDADATYESINDTMDILNKTFTCPVGTIAGVARSDAGGVI
jgi:hypothetical protein